MKNKDNKVLICTIGRCGFLRLALYKNEDDEFVREVLELACRELLCLLKLGHENGVHFKLELDYVDAHRLIFRSVPDMDEVRYHGLLLANKIEELLKFLRTHGLKPPKYYLKPKIFEDSSAYIS